MERHHAYEKQSNASISGRCNLIAICVGLAAVTIAAYWPSLCYDFVGYDDPLVIVENRHVSEGLSSEGIKWAFSLNGYAGNWDPLTWLSHMLDCELFGLNAGYHHLTNLLLHTASTVLLLLVLTFMTGRVWPSAFVAAAFALHPLQVESVAWITARKDVLSGFFWILTMVAYHRYTRSGRMGSYILTLVVFGMGLLAKPMMVTLPFVLLLLDYWPLKRFAAHPDRQSIRTVRNLILEKLPFIILSIGISFIAYLAQQAGGALSSAESSPFYLRMANAAVFYVTYLFNIIWPANLTVLYPIQQIPFWQHLAAISAVIGFSVIATLLIRRSAFLAVGWFWFIGTLIPVIGLVEFGSQRVADRFTYIPLIGVFLVAVWAARHCSRARPGLRPVLTVASVLVLILMFIGTRMQLRHWENGFALCQRAIQVTEQNSIMHCGLAKELEMRGAWDEAVHQYRRALQISPEYEEAHNNLGVLLMETGRNEQAMNHFSRALEINPEQADVHVNMGFLLANTGRTDEAINHFRRALEINPQDAGAHFLMGTMVAMSGQSREAIAHYRQAVKIQPDFTKASANLAWMLTTVPDPALRNPAEAVHYAERAIELAEHIPPELVYTLAAAYASTGRYDEAESAAEEALVLATAAGNNSLVQEINDLLMRIRRDRGAVDS